MARTVAIGIQNFEDLIQKHYFYVDKTLFIKEWWDSGDSVTLITRPRRFGKTLNMSMTEQFFSLDYAGRGDLFEGLSVWEYEEYRRIQGTYPVISQCKGKGLCRNQGQDLSDADGALCGSCFFAGKRSHGGPGQGIF